MCADAVRVKTRVTLGLRSSWAEMTVSYLVWGGNNHGLSAAEYSDVFVTHDKPTDVRQEFTTEDTPSCAVWDSGFRRVGRDH